MRLVVARDTVRLLVVLIALIAALLVAARVSDGLFVITAVLLLSLLSVLTYRAPQAALISVIFVPIVDRYLFNLLLPLHLQEITTYFSEALLLVVAVAITLRGLRAGTLLPAIRHPVVGFVALFMAVGAISAVANDVPPFIAGAGILFTVDATALFVLPRVVGFTERQARFAASGLVAMALLAAVLALGQVVLEPDFLGLQSFTGRFGEGTRFAAFLVNPNMLGAILAMALPFSLMGAVRLPSRGERVAAVLISLILALALFYTFSRGAWLGLGVAMLLVGVALERRALLLMIVVGAIAVGAAFVVPRGILLDEADRAKVDLGEATLGRLDTGEGQDLRLLFVENAAPILADHPVVGAGPGRYGGAIAAGFGSPLYDQYTAGVAPRNRTVDSFWLHLIVEFGVLGALLFASSIAVAVREVIGAGRRSRGVDRGLLAGFAAVAVILVVDSLTEMLLEGNTTSFSLWLFLGIGTVVAKRAVVSG